MAKKGETTLVTTFTKYYEEHLITQIDNNTKQEEITIKFTKTVKLSTCSLITRERKQKHKRKLMN